MKRNLLVFIIAGVFIVLLSNLTLGAWAAPIPQSLGTETPPERPIYEVLVPEPAPQGNIPQRIEPSQFPQNIPVGFSKLVLQSIRDNNWEIYSIDETYTYTRLTNNVAVDVEARFDQGCQKIVFTSNRSGNFDLYRMNSDGSGLTQLTNQKDTESNPAWSPDGTKILYQSNQVKVGGTEQYDVYVMNADGTGQTRLTTHGDYDGEPAWSPDGSRIAFVSKRTGGYRIYTMNPDGSNIVQLSNQAYSSYPVWDPDNRVIAYSADGDGDGWLELWMMDANGANQTRLYSPLRANSDIYVRSWSPDGRYIAYTEVTYVQDSGTWYWIDASIVYYTLGQGGDQDLVPSAYEWSPDWRSTDNQPPTSSLQSLPAISPGPLLIQWSGSDNGPTGIRGYDIQVRDGTQGNWTEWLALTKDTSAYYPGVGGHTYYFRARAVDMGGNLEAWPAAPEAYTQVEPWVPDTKIKELDLYSPNGVLIDWNGFDPGGSGIRSYDIQYRDLQGGGWLDWFSGVQTKNARFWGTPGHTYEFRSRAIDRAENLEEWPGNDADTTTTLISWGIEGRVEDISGAPVSGSDMDVAPTPGISYPSNPAGYYGIYGFTPTEMVTATWGKSGYGNLPSMMLNPGQTNTNVVVIPPVENQIQDWGFESNNPGGVWQMGGISTAHPDPAARHSGAYGLQIGDRLEGFGTPQKVGEGWYPLAALDMEGNLHIAWTGAVGNQNDIFYAFRNRDGIWSVPENISQSPQITSGAPAIVTTPGGSIHLMWKEANPYGHPDSGWYTSTNTGSGWAAPHRVYEVFYNDPPSIVVDSSGVTHMVWRTDFDVKLYYATITEDGLWSNITEVLNGGTFGEFPTAVIDATGTIHVVWTTAYAPYQYGVQYIQRGPDGVWSQPQFISNSNHLIDYNGKATMDIDDQGILHVSWYSPNNGGAKYTRRLQNGDWTPVLEVPSPFSIKAKMAVGPDGRAHFIWIPQEAFPAIKYVAFNPASGWSSVETIHSINDDTWPVHSMNLHIDESGDPRLIWNAGYIRQEIYYSVRNVSGAWDTEINISQSPDIPSSYPVMTIDQNLEAHIVWSEDGDLTYVGPRFASTTGDIQAGQTITLPAGLGSQVLSFVYKLDGASSANGTSLSVEAEVSGSTVTLFSTSSTQAEWKHIWTDLSQWAGEGMTITFKLHQVEGFKAPVAYIDEVVVAPANPGLWVDLGCPQNAEPGEVINCQASFGNLGGAVASSTQLSATLPVNWTFINSSLTPVIQEQDLTWDLGEIPGWDDTSIITFTLQVPITATGNATESIIANIHSTTPEPEIEDNRSSTEIWTGYRLFLPGVVRFR